MIKRMERIQHELMECVECHMENLASVNTEEMGEVIDMIKDLSEAIYYSTITHSMNTPKPAHEMTAHEGMVK